MPRRPGEWKYARLRRYFAFLQRAIYVRTLWARLEATDEATWARARRTVDRFLARQWRGGALVGARPKDAWFVRCDRTTMTQSDIDSGRLIILVGVATVRPAEFVLFRIGQWTSGGSDPDPDP